MDICIIGSGVIGTIYGHVLSGAGNDVTHLVRPGHGANLREGVEIRLLDSRAEGSPETRARYRPRVVGRLNAIRPCDLILASVRHYQVPELLPVLASEAGTSEILFFNDLASYCTSCGGWIARGLAGRSGRCGAGGLSIAGGSDILSRCPGAPGFAVGVAAA